MRRFITFGASVLLTVAAARSAGAQWNLARFESDRDRVYASYGLDPALVGAVGYAHVLRVWGHDFQLAGDVGAVTAGMDAHDFRARLGTQSSIVQWRSVHLAGSATFITRGTENAIYRGRNFGADVTGTLGYYRPRWFASGEFGKDKAIITHVTHSDWYRAHYYADARDGWYLDAGGTFHYGVAGGLTVGRTEIAARAGWLRTERFNALTPPAYATLSVGVGW